MTDRAKKYLYDIQSSIDMVEQFTLTANTFERYCEDLKTQRAVERKLGIIGEAVNHFNKLEMDQPIAFATQIAGFRNRLIHSYDSIDNAIIWTIIKRHLPLLKKEVVEKLNEGDKED
jgi:uncharacterized protein with HEPN domain